MQLSTLKTPPAFQQSPITASATQQKTALVATKPDSFEKATPSASQERSGMELKLSSELGAFLIEKAGGLEQLATGFLGKRPKPTDSTNTGFQKITALATRILTRNEDGSLRLRIDLANIDGGGKNGENVNILNMPLNDLHPFLRGDSTYQNAKHIQLELSGSEYALLSPRTELTIRESWNLTTKNGGLKIVENSVEPPVTP